MENINIQMVLITIVIGFLAIIIIRTIIRKNKRIEMHNITKTKYKEIQELMLESSDALERTEQISKNDESITLFNKWYKEYKSIEEDMNDIDVDYEELTRSFERAKHHDFLELDKSLGYKLDVIDERLRELHKRLFNFTSYELENTGLAIDIKSQLKELQNNFELNLKFKEIYTQSFEHECEKIESELTRFEDLQKMGEYTKGRKHLRNATDIINNIDFNYDVIINMINYITQLNTNIEIIDTVREQISDKKFRLDENQFLSNYEMLKAKKEDIAATVDELSFTTVIEDEFIQNNEEELVSIQDDIFNIKSSIEEQYAQIKIIEENIEQNEELFVQCKTLVDGALDERDEINELYEMPENRAIQRLEIEISRFEKFCADYEVLLDVVYDLKEDYTSLVNRVMQSNEYIRHFIINMKEAIEGLRSIRIDEIKALESIESYKSRITNVEFYISANDHLFKMSHGLSNLLTETYEKISQLEEMLNSQPLNISDVRKLTRACESMLNDIESSVDQEIKLRTNAQALIRFTNRFVEDTQTQNVVSHCMTLYNNKNYNGVVKELRQFIHSNFENPETLYEQIIGDCMHMHYSSYSKEL